MKKRLLGIKSALSLLLIGLFAFNTAYAANTPKPKKEKARLDDVLNMETSTTPKSSGAYKRKAVKYDSGTFRDPFSNPFTPVQEDQSNKPKAKEIKLPPLAVQGISWGANYPTAIINNKVVKAGDKIEGVTILAIDNKEILVQYQEKNFQIPSPALTVVDTKTKPKGGRK
jgi:hypothetical protein